MFQRLTSLFFSDSSLPEGLEEPKPFVSEEEEEDGWLVIDLGGGAARPGAQRRAGACGCSVRPCLVPPPAPAHARSPVPTLPGPCLMDESWFVTPPPCFTAEEPGPDGVGSSPMEDLLIEHPSMSVYVTSTLELDAEEPQDSAAGEVPEPRLERHTPHHTTSLSVKAAILEKVSQARRVQRAKQLAEKPWLSQKALQRQDRARQRPARRARQRAGSFLHQPCQRHCNY
ncbi:tumor protein p53-inducible nuclear protein 2 isoform X2 [Anas acuta]|uniref:Tumor protein p53-inducible nuclear protein 2 isoform X1 n=1 Tax=Aythya fuligula TaxID=219594 RepID=A0A6J3DWJ2_AYTFU|nr:tumor protein p53-inducible nuclear protein 2 isoform X2 [Anas platyrhynchos]XP_032054295.1 tumor protein p53-inducible nuclear protein 2 isoform X1 [Aythya fuligula]|eukprot:XP_027328718.1 tumor protein p53-inducible nuclear protein 2 isoform X2 [Anas platyrhynchos]